MSRVSYFSLTKPGIIFGNLITTIGGFYLVRPHASFYLLLFTLLGISLVIASGCVFNNYIDRDIDPLMERTKNRATALGLISTTKLLLFGTLLGLLGFSVLFFFTNMLVTFIAFLGFFFYSIAYSLYFKRFSIYGTAIGSISGAVPPVVGYCAASHSFNIGAVIVFFMLVFWQMPHSYAIAIYRLKDYMSANIPVLPVKKSMRYTKISMLVYVIIFSAISMLPTYFGYTGNYYLTAAVVLSLYWIYLTAKGLKSNNDVLWARKVFSFSIILITLLSFMMVID